MSFNKQIAAARKIMEYLEVEAPADNRGVIEKPYRDWIAQLRTGLEKAREWSEALGEPRGDQDKTERG